MWWGVEVVVAVVEVEVEVEVVAEEGACCKCDAGLRGGEGGR